MDLSSPISSLTPSLDGAVLEVLAGTEAALGVSQIHRLARRGARSGMHRVLDRLTLHGLVIAEPTNLGSIYRLNRKHLLAGPILEAAHARQTFLQRLRQACAALQPSVTCAALYGSTARRESGPDSDVDLVLVIPDDGQTEVWDDQIRSLEDEVLAWTGNRLECLVLTESHLRTVVEAGERIVEDLGAESITLVGVSLPSLLRNDGGTR